MKRIRADRGSAVSDAIGRAELAEAITRSRIEPAQGGASGGPLLGLIVENDQYNRYTVQLAVDGGAGEEPDPLSGEQVQAINLAEPFDATGELQADDVVLLWPSQGLYLFARAAASEGGQGSPSFWAKVVSGSGPDYAVRQQIATDADSFADAAGTSNVTAYNTWELSVDGSATADVPAGALVRVWEEPDSGETTRRFFSYPLHAVYR